MSRKYPKDMARTKLAEPQQIRDKFRSSDQFLQSVIENANLWINVLDQQENVLIWNKAAEIMSGYSAEEAIGHAKVWEWLYPEEDYRKQVTEQVANLMKRGKAEMDVDTKITCKDGKVKIISWNERSLLDQNGSVIGSIAIGRDITKRQQLEQQLQESEKKYRAMVENSPNLIGIFQDGVLKYINSAAILNLGWTFEELTSPSFDPIKNAVSKKSQTLLKESIGKRLRGENVGSYEINLIRKDGSELSVVVRAAKIMYDGKPAIQFSFNDITERKVAEEKLREGVSYSRSLIEASLDPLVTISEKGQITDVNRATELITEFSREHLIGSDFSNYFTDPKKARIAYLEVFAKGFLKDYPLAIRGKSGKVTEVLYNASVYRDEAGKVRGVFAAARDVTELKQAEEALRKSEESVRISEKRLREAMEATSDGLWEWNVETGEMYYSPAWHRILGYVPGELQENIQTWKELVHPDDRDRAIRMNEECIDNRIPKFEVEYRMRAKGGEWKWILGRGKATTRSADGRALRMVGTHADVTERKRMEERLKFLHEHALGLASATNIDDIVKYTLDTIQFTLGFSCVDFNLVEDGMVVVKGTRGWDKGSYSVGINEPSVVAKAAREMTSIRVDDTRKTPDYLDRMGRDWKGPPTMLSELATPVIIDNQTVAVLNVESAQSNAFSEIDQRLLETLASHLASTLKRGRLERELKNYSGNLETVVEERTKELRSTKERLDYLITSNPAAIYSGKPLADLSDWELTYLSDRVVPMLGFEPEKFVGHPEFWKQHVHPEDLGPVTEAVPRLWEEGQHIFEYRILHKNGDYRWIRNEARVGRDGDGKPIEVNGYWTDITEKKRVELENEKLNTELTTRLSDVTDRLESLAKSREKLKAAPDVATGLDVILETVLWDFDLDFGAVLVLDRQANRMIVRASKSKGKEIRLDESYPLQGFVELRDLQAKSTTRVVGKGDSSIFGTAIVHSIPILAGNEIYGVLAFGNEEQRPLREGSVRILELYAELVSSLMIEKAVAVTPVLESKIAERMSGLESGQMYLVKKDPAKAFEVFASTVFSGYEGLCITRMYPPKVRTKHGLEKTPIVWLTSEASEGEKSVHSIQDLSILIGDYLVKAEKAVVLIDGFEYLITNHGFESFLKFLQIVKDRLQRRNAILIAPVLEQALAPKELALIEREMQALDNGTRSDSKTISKSR